MKIGKIKFEEILGEKGKKYDNWLDKQIEGYYLCYNQNLYSDEFPFSIEREGCFSEPILLAKTVEEITNKIDIELAKNPEDHIFLDDFINNKNLFEISSSSKERLENKIQVLECGYRNGEPVALLRNIYSSGYKEYVIAINYEIKGKDISWGYGYYYDQDIVKAKSDFNRVKNGEFLTDTFNELENNVIQRYEYKIEPREEYPYQVRVLNSIDNGKNFYYSGVGKNLKTKAEMKLYIGKLNAMGIYAMESKNKTREER